MKAFISYSLNDKDQYILTLLSTELRKRGFVIRQSNDFHTEMSSLTKVNINQSQLFIGLLTGDGHEVKRVQKEWRFASKSKIPRILLIENTVRLNGEIKAPHIIFDRYNPQSAIDSLTRKINQKKKKSNQDSKALSWILGGAALLAIIGLLSNDD